MGYPRTVTASTETAALSTLAKGTTPVGNPTSVAIDANTQGLDVAIKAPMRGLIQPTINGSIAVANASQVGIAAKPDRNYLLFLNYSTADMWINYGTAAGVDIGTPIGAGASYEIPFAHTGTVTVFCAVTGSKFAFIEA